MRVFLTPSAAAGSPYFSQSAIQTKDINVAGYAGREGRGGPGEFALHAVRVPGRVAFLGRCAREDVIEPIKIPRRQPEGSCV